MQKKIIVLGSGLVGSAIALDLAGKHNVTAVDQSTNSFEKLRDAGITTLQADLSIPGKVREAVAGFDLAVGALPGFMGYAALKEIIEAGINLVDISFMPEDFLELDGLAKKMGVTAVVDCGVAPRHGKYYTWLP